MRRLEKAAGRGLTPSPLVRSDVLVLVERYGSETDVESPALEMVKVPAETTGV